MKNLPLRPLLAALLAGLLVRSLGVGEVFATDAQGQLDIFLHRADSSYHARRALYSAVNFPQALLTDRYIAYPDGAVVPMPPFYDWALGGAARLFGGSLRSFEWIAALVSPILGTLAAVPIAMIGMLVGGSSVAALSAWIYALLPMASQWQRLGDADHHAAVAFLGASYLALAAQLALREGSLKRCAALAAGLAAARCALATTWSGSLLYLGVLEAAIAIALLATPGRARLAANAAGLALSAWFTAGVVAACPTPRGGPFTTTTLSWTHVVALAAAAAATALVAGSEALWPPRGSRTRWLRAAALAALVGAVALALFPELAEGLRPGAAFLAGDDSWASNNPEQMPLVGWIRVPGIERPLLGIGHQLYGGFLYLIPIVPIAFLRVACDAARRGPALCLAVFACVLAPLAVLQLRFGNDFAPAAAVGSALALDWGRRRLAPRLGTRAAGLACAALTALLCLPGAWLSYLDPARTLLGQLGLRSLAPPAVPHDIAGHSLIRFARRIRELTPETSGYFDAGIPPEYSVLCNPGHGGVVVYAARRPVAANNFGPYLDAEKFLLVRRFFGEVTSEAGAVAIAEQLGARFVLSFDYSRMRETIFAYQLHRLDGSERGGAPALQQFRLLAESEPGDLPLWHDFPDGAPGYRSIPYKLFERVAGAVLEVEAAPGAPITARIPLRTTSGRDFVYRQTASADAAGRARLVLPYASERGGDRSRVTRAEGPYRIEAGDRVANLELSEREVIAGEERRLSLR